MRLFRSFAVAMCGMLTGCCTTHYPQPAGTYNWAPDPSHAARLHDEEINGNGIEVGAPKFYDDASLRMMLDATRATLASMTGLDQSSLIAALGNVSGATIDQTQFGLQVTGGAGPSTVSTNTGPTSSTTANTGLPQGNTSLPQSSTVATAPTQSTVTTSPTPQTPPTVPSGLAFTPAAGISASSLDLLNQEMQLSYQMTDLELLLEGALSDRFVTNQRFIKPRVTIGFPISLRAAAYKDAAAVVEVTVRNDQPNLSDGADPDPPSLTVILPRENTYNVAAMTDNMTSIGAGAVIGTVGIASSYLHGRKTLYLVQDQDTVAIQRPSPQDPNATSFLWEFHPVLGEHYVRSDMKQTFAQLTFPSIADVDCYGVIEIRTYWRRFDQKTGLVGNVIAGSVLKSRRLYSIPRYDLSPQLGPITYQDLGDGTLLVSVAGDFLNGTYVQIGNLRFDAGRNLQLDHSGLRFTVPASALAQWTGWVIARDGEASALVQPDMQRPLEALDQTACKSPAKIAAAQQAAESPAAQSATSSAQRPASQSVAHAAICPYGGFHLIRVHAGPVSEATMELNVRLDTTTVSPYFDDQFLLSVAGKIFGLRDSPIRRRRLSGGDLMLTAPVPTALFLSDPIVKVFRLFYFDTTAYQPGCWYAASSLASNFSIGADADSLTLLSADTNGTTTYLLSGNGLANARIDFPTSGVTMSALDHTRSDQFRFVTLTKAALAAGKKIVLQKGDSTGPILLDIPTSKTPSATVSVDSPLIQNTQQTDIGVDNSANVKDVKYKDKLLNRAILDKSTIRLLSLRDDGVTDQQRTAHLTVEYKDGSKASVTIQVVAARVSVQTTGSLGPTSTSNAKSGTN